MKLGVLQRIVGAINLPWLGGLRKLRETKLHLGGPERTTAYGDTSSRFEQATLIFRARVVQLPRSANFSRCNLRHGGCTEDLKPGDCPNNPARVCHLEIRRGILGNACLYLTRKK